MSTKWSCNSPIIVYKKIYPEKRRKISESCDNPNDIIQFINWNVERKNTPPPIIGCVQLLNKLLKGEKNITTDINSYSLIYDTEEENIATYGKGGKQLEKAKMVYKHIFQNEMKNTIPLSVKNTVCDPSIEYYINHYINTHPTIPKTLNCLMKYANNTKYLINDIERDYLSLIAKNIQFFCKMNGSRSSRYSRYRNEHSIVLQGLLGEYGVTRILGLPCQIHFTYPRNVKNDTFDLAFPDSLKVDVKTVLNVKSYDLLVGEGKGTNPADLYILVQINFKCKDSDRLVTKTFTNTMKEELLVSKNYDIEIEIVGYATKSMVYTKKAETYSKMMHKFHIVKREELLTLEQVINKLKKEHNN